MAVLAEFLEELFGVPDDLVASDLDEVKQHRAETIAQLGAPATPSPRIPPAA